MREILFRGKTKNRKDAEWIEGSLVRGVSHHDKSPVVFIYDLETEMDGRGWIGNYWGEEVGPETVGQYTGLNDKNGKKIFEGDLCDMCILSTDHILVKIVSMNGCVGFDPVHYDEVHPDDRHWKSFWCSDECEMWNLKYFTVIGNIHDNPELLEDK